MFQKTRIKLTFWYVALLLLVSVVFSVIIYAIVSSQIERFIRMQNDRLHKFDQLRSEVGFIRPPNQPPYISEEELRSQEKALIFNLVISNIRLLS